MYMYDKNRIRTDHTMAKQKMTRGPSLIHRPLHGKVEIEQHEPHCWPTYIHYKTVVH